MLRKLKHGGNISIERVEALAKALGVQARDLMSETLEQELDNKINSAELVSIYASTSELGRDTIDQAFKVAERLLTYNANRTDPD